MLLRRQIQAQVRGAAHYWLWQMAQVCISPQATTSAARAGRICAQSKGLARHIPRVPDGLKFETVPCCSERPQIPDYRTSKSTRRYLPAHPGPHSNWPIRELGSGFGPLHLGNGCTRTRPVKVRIRHLGGVKARSLKPVLGSFAIGMRHGSFGTPWTAGGRRTCH